MDYVPPRLKDRELVERLRFLGGFPPDAEIGELTGLAEQAREQARRRVRNAVTCGQLDEIESHERLSELLAKVDEREWLAEQLGEIVGLVPIDPPAKRCPTVSARPVWSPGRYDNLARKQQRATRDLLLALYRLPTLGDCHIVVREDPETGTSGNRTVFDTSEVSPRNPDRIGFRAMMLVCDRLRDIDTSDRREDTRKILTARIVTRYPANFEGPGSEARTEEVVVPVDQVPPLDSREELLEALDRARVKAKELRGLLPQDAGCELRSVLTDLDGRLAESIDLVRRRRTRSGNEPASRQLGVLVLAEMILHEDLTRQAATDLSSPCGKMVRELVKQVSPRSFSEDTLRRSFREAREVLEGLRERGPIPPSDAPVEPKAWRTLHAERLQLALSARWPRDARAERADG